MLTLAAICLVLGALPSTLLLLNLIRFRAPPPPSADWPEISVLIPARNEAANIRACVESVQASEYVKLEVLVLDDHSTDETGVIVRELADRDPRVRILRSQPLPNGWCGKQFACHQLSQHATGELFCFIDADVRLESQALARAAAYLQKVRADLVSSVPRQFTLTFSERLLVPLIHFVLLAYLPFGLMRRFRHAAFAAGCGQFFMARAQSYRQAGGHQSLAASGHDGIQLPRVFRTHGFRTDLFDVTGLASCRMYPASEAVWSGFAKNAVEGIANPKLILPFTALFLLGQVLPPFLLVAALLTGMPAPVAIVLGVGTTINYAARIACSWRFRQSWLGAALHPLGILSLLGIQWWALYQEKRGRQFLWKGRPQRRLAA